MKGISTLSSKLNLVIQRKESWDSRFLDLAEQISGWSKDPSRKIGAVAIGSEGQVLAQGYNGFPRGIHDNIGLLEDKKSKYDRIVHAEMNVIYNACYNGVSLDGASLYIYGLPLCSKCCIRLIQVGIKRVIMKAPKLPKRWNDSWKLSEKLLSEANINFYLHE